MPFFLCGGIYVAFLLAGVFSSWADHADITLFQLPGKDIPLTAVVVSVCSGATRAALRCAAPTWRCKPGPNAMRCGAGVHKLASVLRQKPLASRA